MVIKITLGARDFSSAVSGFCQVFLVTCAYGQRCVGLRPTPKIPAVRGKNLWYPGMIMMGSSEEIFWGGKSAKIQLYSAINIKSLVLFRFAKLHKRNVKLPKTLY